jgi:2-polyprenyl-3-methyl-5-hydroxy-6-metoxy-1,4-benzoquinol methylase
MPLPRTLETEVMDTEQEARDYDAMDHAEVNGLFCEDLLAMRTRLGRVLDVGTGTARIPIELCRRCPGVTVEAIDLATHMLALAQRNVLAAGLGDRISVSKRDAKSTGWDPGSFDTVISNSIVHHIPEPRDILHELWRLVRGGGVLFVRDLERPDSEAKVAALVAKHATVPASLPPDRRAMFERQRDLFEASLRAGLTADEVRAMIAGAGIPASAVRTTSDRHWTLATVKP